MPTWRSAEQLFADDQDDPGPAFGGALFAQNANRIILKPMISHGTPAFTAVYRCQAPDPDCQCFDCSRARTKAKRT